MSAGGAGEARVQEMQPLLREEPPPQAPRTGHTPPRPLAPRVDIGVELQQPCDEGGLARSSGSYQREHAVHIIGRRVDQHASVLVVETD